MRREGVRAFFRAFWFNSLTSIPAQIAYLSSYNIVKERLENHNLGAIAPFVAGGVAEAVGVSCFVPIDVVMNRTITQGLFATGADGALVRSQQHPMSYLGCNGAARRACILAPAPLAALPVPCAALANASGRRGVQTGFPFASIGRIAVALRAALARCTRHDTPPRACGAPFPRTAPLTPPATSRSPQTWRERSCGRRVCGGCGGARARTC